MCYLVWKVGSIWFVFDYRRSSSESAIQSLKRNSHLAPEQLMPLTKYLQEHRRVVCHAEDATLICAICAKWVVDGQACAAALMQFGDIKQLVKGSLVANFRYTDFWVA